LSFPANPAQSPVDNLTQIVHDLEAPLEKVEVAELEVNLLLLNWRRIPDNWVIAPDEDRGLVGDDAWITHLTPETYPTGPQPQMRHASGSALVPRILVS
jgi:hypothetical protein